MIPFISFKPRAGDVHAGLWTKHLRELAGFLAEIGHPTVPIVYHEPENDMAGETFAAMFNRCREELKSVYADLPICYSALAYRWRPSTSSNTGTTDPLPWTRVKADVYGVDVYSGETWPTDAILPEHPGFVRWYETMIKPYPGRKFTLTERGFQGDDSVRAAAIAREAAWLVGRTDCEGYIYWNTPGTENDDNWLLDPDGEAAVRYLIESTSPSIPPVPPQPEPPREYINLINYPGLSMHQPTGVVVADVEAHRKWWTYGGMPVIPVAGPVEPTGSVVTAAAVPRPSPRPEVGG
jgi:hypothetical protein